MRCGSLLLLNSTRQSQPRPASTTGVLRKYKHTLNKAAHSHRHIIGNQTTHIRIENNCLLWQSVDYFSMRDHFTHNVMAVNESGLIHLKAIKIDCALLLALYVYYSALLRVKWNEYIVRGQRLLLLG